LYCNGSAFSRGLFGQKAPSAFVEKKTLKSLSLLGQEGQQGSFQIVQRIGSVRVLIDKALYLHEPDILLPR